MIKLEGLRKTILFSFTIIMGAFCIIGTDSGSGGDGGGS
jgi:hypothetical protein